MSSPWRRPVKAAVRKIAASCSESAARTSAMISSGEKTLISVREAVRGFSTSATGFVGQPVELAGSLHDAVEDGDRLLARAVREPAVRVDLVRRPALDALGREVLEQDRRRGAGGRGCGRSSRSRAASTACAGGPARCSGGTRRRRRRPSRRCGPCPGSVPAAASASDAAQPGLGGALREVARRRTASRGPGRAERLLDLAAVGQAVLRSPDRAALALEAEDVAGDRAQLIMPDLGDERPKSRPTGARPSGHIWDTVDRASNTARRNRNRRFAGKSERPRLDSNQRPAD